MRKGPPAPGEDPNFDLMVAEELKKRGMVSPPQQGTSGLPPNYYQYYPQNQPNYYPQGQPQTNQGYHAPLEAPRGGKGSYDPPPNAYAQSEVDRSNYGHIPGGQPPYGQPADYSQAPKYLPPRELFSSPHREGHSQPYLNDQNQPNMHHPPSNQPNPQQPVNIPPISFPGHQASFSQDPSHGRGRGRQEVSSNHGPAGILGGNSTKQQQHPYQHNNHGFGRGLGTLDGVGNEHGGQQKQKAYAAALAAQVAEKEARKKAEKVGGMRASLERLHNSPRDAMGFAVGGAGGKGSHVAPVMNNGYGNNPTSPAFVGGKGMPPNYGGYGKGDKAHVSYTSPANVKDEKYERRQKELDYAAELRKQMEEVKERKQRQKYEEAQEDAKFNPGAAPAARVRGKALGVYSSPNKPGGVYGGGGYGNAPPPSGSSGYGAPAPNGPGGYSNVPAPNGPGGYGGPVPSGPGGYGTPAPNGLGGYSSIPAPNGPGGYGGPVPSGPGGYGAPAPNGPGGYGASALNGPGGYSNAPPNGPGGYGASALNGPGGYPEGSSRSRLISGVPAEDKAAARDTALQQKRALELQMEEKKAAKAKELAAQRAEEEADRLAEERANQAMEAEKAAEKEAKRREEQEHLDKLYRDQEEAVRLRKAGKMKEAERLKRGDTPREESTPRTNSSAPAGSALNSDGKQHENDGKGSNDQGWPGSNSEAKVAHSPRGGQDYQHQPFQQQQQQQPQLQPQQPQQPQAFEQPTGQSSYRNQDAHNQNHQAQYQNQQMIPNQVDDYKDTHFNRNTPYDQGYGGYDVPLSDRSRGIDFTGMVNEEMERQRAQQPPSRGVTFDERDSYHNQRGGYGHENMHGNGGYGQEDIHEIGGGKGGNGHENMYGRGGGKGGYEQEDMYERGGGKGGFGHNDMYARGGGKGGYEQEDKYERGGGKGDFGHNDMYGRGGGKGGYEQEDMYERGGGKGDFGHHDMYGRGGGKGGYEQEDMYERGGGKGGQDDIYGRRFNDPMEKSLAARSELLPQSSPRGRFRENTMKIDQRGQSNLYDHGQDVNPPQQNYYDRKGERPYISPGAQQRVPYPSFESINGPIQSENVESLDDFVGDWQRGHPPAEAMQHRLGMNQVTPQRSALKSKEGSRRMLTPGEQSLGGESLLMYLGQKSGGRGGDGEDQDQYEKNIGERLRHGEEELQAAADALEPHVAIELPSAAIVNSDNSDPFTQLVLQRRLGGDHGDALMSSLTKGQELMIDSENNDLSKPMSELFNAFEKAAITDHSKERNQEDLQGVRQYTPPQHLKISKDMHSVDDDMSPLRSASTTPTSMKTDGNLSVPNRPPPSFPLEPTNPVMYQHESKEDGQDGEDVQDEEEEEELHAMPGPSVTGKSFQVHTANVVPTKDMNTINEYKNDDEQPWNKNLGEDLNRSVNSNATSVSSFDGSVTH